MRSSDHIIASTSADLESADRALMQRPRFSVRLRLTIRFMMTFVLICGMTLSAVIFISRLGAKQLFIEKSANYTFEIQQARRFEKNFLLYGSDLSHALSYVRNARNVLTAAHDDFCSIIGNAAYATMAENLNRYRILLEQLGRLKEETRNGLPDQRYMFQSELRHAGAELVADAANATDKERLSFHRWLRSARIVAACAMVLILGLEIYILVFIARQIFIPFRRFENYMRRIAAGDFSPVTPVKRYQDEFTDLAVAVNRMLQEIQDRGNQLMESRKMAAVGTLSAGIAHEINNPLNNISLTAEALIDEYDELSDPEKIEMLKEIFGQVARAGATVANLLDFTHRDQSAFKPLDIGEILESSVALLSNDLLLSNITLNITIDKHLPAVNGHRQNLQQVFLNLFLNAGEAMPDGGELSISGHLQGDFVRIDISDTGCGIGEQDLNRIFDPFFTTKEVGKGTGLGLSVSFGIIEKHHGSIRVKSETGKGTTFSIRLPVAADAGE